MISEHLPVHQSDDFVPNHSEFECADDFSGIFVCGSKPMINLACIPALEELNIPAENRFVF